MTRVILLLDFNAKMIMIDKEELGQVLKFVSEYWRWTGWPEFIELYGKKIEKT